MEAPKRAPKKGFYYHYKHDSKESLNNYAYEVMGVGHHTEEEGSYFVIYRPLYKGASVYKSGKMFDIRPLNMFMEKVTKDGKTFPRFKKITDARVIGRLKRLRKEMYKTTR